MVFHSLWITARLERTVIVEEGDWPGQTGSARVHPVGAALAAAYILVEHLEDYSRRSRLPLAEPTTA